MNVVNRGLRASFFGVLALAAVILPSVARAAEPDKAVCADAYRDAQTHRKNGELRSARKSLVLCASDSCPAVLQPDCLRWLTEVEGAMPTLSFAAKGPGGEDLVDVRVFLDGERLTETLDGKATAVDPGSHVVRFEHGTDAPIEQSIVVREGEKARVVTGSWERTPAPATAPSTPEGEKEPSSGPPLATWIFGGVGVAGLATFTVLGLAGLQRRSALERDCYGACDASRVDSVKRQFVAADIALGVGALSLGVATVLLLTSGSKDGAKKDGVEAITSFKPPPVHIDVSIKPGGGTAGISGIF